MRPIIALLSDDQGATAVEYGLLTIVVSVACIAIWVAMGNQVKAPFVTVQDTVHDVNTSAGG